MPLCWRAAEERTRREKVNKWLSPEVVETSQADKAGRGTMGQGAAAGTGGATNQLPDPCRENPLIAGCPNTEGGGQGNNSPTDLKTVTVENILRSNCGQCHGSAILNAQDARAGMNYIDDFEKLLVEGQAIEGDSENARRFNASAGFHQCSPLTGRH